MVVDRGERRTHKLSVDCGVDSQSVMEEEEEEEKTNDSGHLHGAIKYWTDWSFTDL